jgi:hypothetical protein
MPDVWFDSILMEVEKVLKINYDAKSYLFNMYMPSFMTELYIGSLPSVMSNGSI